jgi:copper chaperone
VEKMQKSFKINGMSCQHCVMAVKKELQKLNLKNLEVKIGEAVVEFDEELTSVENVIDAITEAGYEVVA